MGTGKRFVAGDVPFDLRRFDFRCCLAGSKHVARPTGLQVFMKIQLKRAYDPPSISDGYRILVDRIWPRGVRKEDARVDLWLKDAAPSTVLRKWFAHDPLKWKEFKKRYFAELENQPSPVEELIKRANQGVVTLVYGAKDPNYNNAVALKEYIGQQV